MPSNKQIGNCGKIIFKMGLSENQTPSENESKNKRLLNRTICSFLCWEYNKMDITYS